MMYLTLDIFESVSFALEGDINLEGSLCTGVHTSWSENFDFSNAWLFEDIEVTCWQPVILETLQVNHSLGWICLLEIEWTVANPEVTFCFVPCLSILVAQRNFFLRNELGEELCVWQVVGCDSLVEVLSKDRNAWTGVVAQPLSIDLVGLGHGEGQLAVDFGQHT